MILDKWVTYVAAPIQINNTSGGITYTGAWTLSSARGFGDYQDDVHYTATNNDSVQYAFTGTGIDLITEKSTGQGNMDIYVDNVFQQTVSAYNASLLSQQTLFSISGLTYGSHTIKAVKKTGTYMILDKFSTRGSSAIQFNNTASGISYTGTWTLNSGRGLGDYNNDVHYTSTNNDYFQYTFTGTGIDLITEKSTGQGNVEIYIDNVLQSTVNMYNASLLSQQTVYSISGLSNASHTLKAIKKTGTYLILDSLRVIH